MLLKFSSVVAIETVKNSKERLGHKASQKKGISEKHGLNSSYAKLPSKRGHSKKGTPLVHSVTYLFWLMCYLFGLYLVLLPL